MGDAREARRFCELASGAEPPPRDSAPASVSSHQRGRWMPHTDKRHSQTKPVTPV